MHFNDKQECWQMYMRTKCNRYSHDIDACEASGVWIFRRAYDTLMTRLTHAR